jgi:hypothetical protein
VLPEIFLGSAGWSWIQVDRSRWVRRELDYVDDRRGQGSPLPQGRAHTSPSVRRDDLMRAAVAAYTMAGTGSERVQLLHAQVLI